MGTGWSHTSVRARRVLGVVIAFAAAFAAAALLTPAAAPAAAPKPFPIAIQIGGQAGPEIAGSMVVWTDNRNGNLDIYGRDLSTRRDYAVCTNRAQQDNPTVTRYVTAGRVHYVAVWVDKRNHPSGESSDIYGRDITTGARFKVAGGATIKWYPGDRRQLGDLGRGRRRRRTVPHQGSRLGTRTRPTPSPRAACSAR